MQCLRQSTISVINFGPVLDFADGVTLETAAGIITSLDHAATGIMLSKNGGTLAVREQGANFVVTTYDAHGCFKVSLSAIDTGTLGRIRVIHTEPATYLAVWRDFMVIPASLYDTVMVAQPTAAILKFFNVAAPTATCLSLPDAVAGAANGLPLIDATGVKLTKTVDLTAGQSISASNMRGTDNAALAATALSTVTWTNARAAKLDTLGGAGAIAHPFIVTQTGGAAVAGAEVWATTDSAGTVVVANGITDANGLYTFYLDAGTYWFWAQHSGLNPASIQETVA